MSTESPTTLPACPWCAAVPSPLGHYYEVIHDQECFFAERDSENTRTIIIEKQVEAWSRRTASDAATLITKLLAAHPHVGRTPGIFGGKLIVGGIRIAVTDILVYLWQGNSIEHICKTYGLTEDQVKCAIAFAQDFIEESDNRGTPAASPSDAAEIVAEMARENLELAISERESGDNIHADQHGCAADALREAERRIRKIS